MTSNKFVDEASGMAIRITANCRRKLRRWLAVHSGMTGYSKWIDMDMESLSEIVRACGGDPDAIIHKAKEEAIDWIFDGK